MHRWNWWLAWQVLRGRIMEAQVSWYDESNRFAASSRLDQTIDLTLRIDKADYNKIKVGR